MIGPSPDWFVGVSGLSLLDSSNQWRQNYQVNLFPYDAGTEDGTEFTLSNLATDPQGVITSIRGTGKFSNVRMARLTFTNQTPDPEPVASFASSASSAGEGSGTRNVTVNLEPAPQSGITLNYGVGGTATAGTDYATLSGSVSVSSGASSVDIPVTITDDNADESDETVVLTLTGSTGYSVGSANRHTLTIRDNDGTPPLETPVASFASSASSAGEGAGTRNVTVNLEPGAAIRHHAELRRGGHGDLGQRLCDPVRVGVGLLRREQRGHPGGDHRRQRGREQRDGCADADGGQRLYGGEPQPAHADHQRR